VTDSEQLPSRILLVDDDEWLRRALATLLRTHGFGIEAYESADSFFEALGDEPPSLVILDYQLPRTTGVAIAAAVKNRFPDNCPPLMLISGSLDDVSDEEQAGFDAVLAKPFPSAALLSTVEALVARCALETR
jgi:DNA-binding response OmpR family regulator